MTFPKGGLTEHRQNIAANPDAFIQDKERSIANWMNHCWKYVRVNSTIKKSQASPIMREMAELVWDAQNGMPLFQFSVKSTGLPMSWNRPQDGELDYIRYEIGHVHPQLEGGLSNPENLTFQSARCNQHIQSSLDIDEVMIYFSNIDEVKDRMDNLKALHESDHWQMLRGMLVK